MSTPPPYPFRSRREIHSGEPKVYSDAPQENASAAADDPTPTPVQGTPAAGTASADDAAAPARRKSVRQRSASLPSFDEVTDTGGTLRVSASDTLGRGGTQGGDTLSETTGMRSRRLDRERRAARKRKRRRRVRSFFIIVLVLGLLAGASYVAYDQLVNTSTTASDDYPGPGVDSVEVTIDEEASGRAIGQTLVDAGVVKSVGAFVRQFEKTSASMSIRPGTYRLKLQMSAAGALAALLDETNRVDSTVTIRSGQKLSEVKQRIVDIMGVSEEDVDAAFADTEAIGLPSEAGGNAEGWLLPGSYEAGETDTPTTLIARMVQGTIDELDRLGVAPADRETVLIKASIVDGEMNIDKYMPMVARVIENRLADTNGETKGMLGMDSTVLYGVGKTSGLPDQADLDNDNPYNTRLHAGLPPTPIGQPSEKAIKAVLNPAEGTWLYFVTVNLETGETLFASTLEEQEKNREQLNAYCTAHPGDCQAS
ncbi:endolytic transglycosylase MltG [Schaalia odontolytica]|uniref:Endolytic murein transglycosylase n=1 Tax=Schaalia odontolytica TaxID=1660 RepID=A0A2X0VRI7_9ACTO|nr:endolytic transglycosylase MltG [Schaalia odontolytica]WMS27334.1 endolytic transglycosylase MltG [Schaalia odontolytica]SPT56542.1 putative aminodeoxychorismate lyase [Schaalia odontolytica]